MKMLKWVYNMKWLWNFLFSLILHLVLHLFKHFTITCLITSTFRLANRLNRHSKNFKKPLSHFMPNKIISVLSLTKSQTTRATEAWGWLIVLMKKRALQCRRKFLSLSIIKQYQTLLYLLCTGLYFVVQLLKIYNLQH